jgi:AcrR family transcriptional regulator
MTTVHLSRDERLGSILRAAQEVIDEKGIEAVNITAIATRSGVSRQWLYDFFPDVEAILATMYEEAERVYFAEDEPVYPGDEDFVQYVQRRCQAFLDMPAAFARVSLHALNVGANTTSPGAALRRMILETYERKWVDGMVAFGYSRDVVYGSVMTILNAALGLNVAVADGLTTKEIASRRLNTVVRAIIG